MIALYLWWLREVGTLSLAIVEEAEVTYGLRPLPLERMFLKL